MPFDKRFITVICLLVFIIIKIQSDAHKHILDTHTQRE